MLKIGFASPFVNVGNTFLSLAISDALASKGNNVILLNLNNKKNNPGILTSYCKGTFTDFINKKIKINDIITRIHELNIDFINLYASDIKLLSELDEDSLKHIWLTFNKSLMNLKKYEYVLINSLNSKHNKINDIIFKSLDYLIIPIDICEYDISAAINIQKYIKTMHELKKKNNTFVLLNKFDHLSKESNNNYDQLRLTFNSILVDTHVPLLNFKNQNTQGNYPAENVIIQSRYIFEKISDFLLKKIEANK